MNIRTHDSDEALRDPLPPNPMPIFRAWFDQARADGNQPNPNAFSLCTVGPDGGPSARIVLCKQIEDDAIVFFTNYTSRKGGEISEHPRVAAVFHWDHADRQVRIEGTATRTGEAESDAYFVSRRVISRLGAWASEQSRPIESREALMERVGEVMLRFGVPIEALTDDTIKADIPRPPHWGGWRIRIARIEPWQGGDGRLHDRAVWERVADAWSVPVRLQP